MKKTLFLSVTAAMFASLLLTSCDQLGGTSTKVPANEVDSLSYAMGVMSSQGLDEHVKTRLGISDEDLPKFLEGIADADTSAEQSAYIQGLTIGMQMKEMVPYASKDLFPEDSTKLIDAALFEQAFLAQLKGEELLMDQAAASAYVATAKYGDTKQEGIDFLEANKSKEGVKITSTGLQYKVEKEGTGATPKLTDKVKVNYHGTLIDGTVFDSSVQRGTPAEFNLQQVIAGWTEGLQLMKEGAKYTFYVPYNLAYGEREAGSIKPFSTLIFEVELLEVEKD